MLSPVIYFQFTFKFPLNSKSHLKHKMVIFKKNAALTFNILMQMHRCLVQHPTLLLHTDSNSCAHRCDCLCISIMRTQQTKTAPEASVRNRDSQTKLRPFVWQGRNSERAKPASDSLAFNEKFRSFIRRCCFSVLCAAACPMHSGRGGVWKTTRQGARMLFDLTGWEIECCRFLCEEMRPVFEE